VTNRKNILIASAIALLVAIYFLTDLNEYLSLEYFQSIKSDLDSLLTQNPVLFIGGFGLVYSIVVAASLPAASVLTITAGALLGSVLAPAVVIPAATIGSLVPYFIAKKLSKPSTKSKYSSSFKKLKKGIDESGWWYLLAARLSAVIPFYALNIVAGIAKIPFKDYATATFFGIIPGTIVFTYAGSQLGESTETGTILRPGVVIALLLLAALPLTVRYAQVKLLKKGKKESDNNA